MNNFKIIKGWNAKFRGYTIKTWVIIFPYFFNLAVPLMLDLYSLITSENIFAILVISFHFHSITNFMVSFYFLQKLVKAFGFGLLEIVVNTNNGVERKNQEIKYDFLKQNKDHTLCSIVTVLVEKFIPDTYSR